MKEGSPAHPSYPAGHAVSNGAFATVLKVNFACLPFLTTVPFDIVWFGGSGWRHSPRPISWGGGCHEGCGAVRGCVMACHNCYTPHRGVCLCWANTK